MKNIMKSRKTTDSTRRKGRDAQADPDEDYLDQDYLETFMREVQEEDYDVVVAGFKRIMPDKTVDHDIIESEFTRVCYTVA